MTSDRRMAVGIVVMLGSGLDVGTVAGTSVGAELLVGSFKSACAGAGGVSRALHAARKRPPAAAPIPRAASRRIFLRVIPAMYALLVLNYLYLAQDWPSQGTMPGGTLLQEPGTQIGC